MPPSTTMTTTTTTWTVSQLCDMIETWGFRQNIIATAVGDHNDDDNHDGDNNDNNDDKGISALDLIKIWVFTRTSMTYIYFKDEQSARQCPRIGLFQTI